MFCIKQVNKNLKNATKRGNGNGKTFNKSSKPKMQELVGEGKKQKIKQPAKDNIFYLKDERWKETKAGKREAQT